MSDGGNHFRGAAEGIESAAARTTATMMSCKKTKQQLSSYLDGMVQVPLRRQIAAHLAECAICRREHAALERTRILVSNAGWISPPDGLERQLKVALSHYSASSLRLKMQGTLVRWQNTLNSFMLPATAGFLSAVIVFGTLIGFIPTPVDSGSGNDVPTLLFTPPRLTSAPFYNFSADSVVVVEADVDVDGRVQEFRIVGGAPDSPALRRQLNNLMILTSFQPAIAFGLPTPGRVVISFSKVSVRG